MKTLFAFSLLVVAASGASAQQSTPPSSRSPGTRLDGIVAVVGDAVITRYDLTERELEMQQRGEIKPLADSTRAATDSAVLRDMVDEELLLQKAKDLKIDVADGEITPQVDAQVKATRGRFASETEFRTALVQAGLGTPDEYRRFLMDGLRRDLTLRRVIKNLQDDGKIVPVNVTDADVQAEYDRTKEFLPKKPASVTFKQIIIAPQASDSAKSRARVRAESLLVELQKGADFEKLAKKESMDQATKDVGGDLGWLTRGKELPQFDRWLFGSGFYAALAPGQISPVFETPYGYHILRVDRVQPGTGEVRARHILIEPTIDSADIQRTQKLADSVAQVWKTGKVPFDTLARKFNDYAGQEETSILEPYPRDSLPMTYQMGFAGKNPGDISVFRIAGSAQRPEVPKFVVAQLLTVDQGGDQTLAELKTAIRSDLAQRGGTRRYVDLLRKQTFVSVRLNEAPALSSKSPDAP